jgi:hypothetical protein
MAVTKTDFSVEDRGGLDLHQEVGLGQGGADVEVALLGLGGEAAFADSATVGGMDGMWKALRQEGFTRLAARFTSTTASPC